MTPSRVKMTRRRFISSGPRPSRGASPTWDAVVEGLRELGYAKGQNVVFEYAYTEGKPDWRLREAARLVATKLDIIVAAGGGVDALALRQPTSTSAAASCRVSRGRAATSPASPPRAAT